MGILHSLASWYQARKERLAKEAFEAEKESARKALVVAADKKDLYVCVHDVADYLGFAKRSRHKEAYDIEAAKNVPLERIFEKSRVEYHPEEDETKAQFTRNFGPRPLPSIEQLTQAVFEEEKGRTCPIGDLLTQELGLTPQHIETYLRTRWFDVLADDITKDLTQPESKIHPLAAKQFAEFALNYKRARPDLVLPHVETASLALDKMEKKIALGGTVALARAYESLAPVFSLYANDHPIFREQYARAKPRIDAHLESYEAKRAVVVDEFYRLRDTAQSLASNGKLLAARKIPLARFAQYNADMLGFSESELASVAEEVEIIFSKNADAVISKLETEARDIRTRAGKLNAEENGSVTAVHRRAERAIDSFNERGDVFSPTLMQHIEAEIIACEAQRLGWYRDDCRKERSSYSHVRRDRPVLSLDESLYSFTSAPGFLKSDQAVKVLEKVARMEDAPLGGSENFVNYVKRKYVLRPGIDISCLLGFQNILESEYLWSSKQSYLSGVGKALELLAEKHPEETFDARVLYMRNAILHGDEAIHKYQTVYSFTAPSTKDRLATLAREDSPLGLRAQEIIANRYKGVLWGI